MKKSALSILSILFGLLLASCGSKEDFRDLDNSQVNENGEENIRVVDLNKQGWIWSWGCNQPTCTYRYAFSQIPPDMVTTDLLVTDILTMNYGPETSTDISTQQRLVDKVHYYIYVQARDSDEVTVGEYKGSKMAVGNNHTCVILSDNQIRCWGANYSGQLGQEHIESLADEPSEVVKEIPPIDLGTGLSAKTMSSGKDYTCVLLSNNQVKCWGLNYGVLGTGDLSSVGDEENEMGDELPAIDLGTDSKGTLIAKVLNTGLYHACVILSNNQVKCWGDNYYGQLGQGNRFVIGDDPNEMGDNLIPVDLGTNSEGPLTVKAIAGGEFHTCAILNHGQVKCWGRNSYGQLGQGHKNDLGDEENEMGDHLPFIDLGTDLAAQAITLGSSFSCAILNHGQVKCWGRNSYGQLGQGHKNELGDEENEMGDHLPFIDLGTDSEGPLRVKTITSGDSHICALLSNDQVKCWGDNSFFQLGQNHKSPRGDEENEMGDHLPFIDFGKELTTRIITSKYDHTCAFLSNNQVKCWGFNQFGQLGQGNLWAHGNGPRFNRMEPLTVNVGDVGVSTWEIPF